LSGLIYREKSYYFFAKRCTFIYNEEIAMLSRIATQTKRSAVQKKLWKIFELEKIEKQLSLHK